MLAVVGVGVTAVHDGVDIDVFGAQSLGHIQQAEQVLLVAVHAAGAHQAHKVDGLAGVDGRLHVADQDVVLLHLAVHDGLGDEGQLLVDDAAGADVGVADLRVAHLAVGQADAHPRRADGDVGAGGEQVVEIGGLGGDDGTQPKPSRMQSIMGFFAIVYKLLGFDVSKESRPADMCGRPGYIQGN